MKEEKSLCQGWDCWWCFWEPHPYLKWKIWLALCKTFITLNLDGNVYIIVHIIGIENSSSFVKGLRSDSTGVGHQDRTCRQLLPDPWWRHQQREVRNLFHNAQSQVRVFSKCPSFCLLWAFIQLKGSVEERRMYLFHCDCLESLGFFFHKWGNKASNTFIKVHPPPPPPSLSLSHLSTENVIVCSLSILAEPKNLLPADYNWITHTSWSFDSL